MKKIGFVFILAVILGFVGFAEDGVTFASDSTYVATLDKSSVNFVANPNASMTLSVAPFSFVTTGNASYDFETMDLTVLNVSEKFDFTYGAFDFYITPTFDLLDNNAMTLPSAFVMTKVVPFTTVTVASDLMGFTNDAMLVTVTAEMIF